MSVTYGTQKWRHFKSFEVFIGLVELYRISGRCVCVVFFNVPPGNKDAVTPNSSRKKKAAVFTTVTTSAYQDQLTAGFFKVFEIFKVCGIESVKFVWELLGRHFHARNMTLNEMNCDLLFDILMWTQDPWETLLTTNDQMSESLIVRC